MKRRKNVCAFFDFDGTLYRGVVALDFLFFLLRNGEAMTLSLKEILVAPKLIYYFILDKLNLADRYNINKKAYGNLKDRSSEWMETASEKFFWETGYDNFFQETVDMLRMHRKNGHRVVIVTSALLEIIGPVSKKLGVDDIIATEVASRKGIYTGEIRRLPVGSNRAAIVRRYCLTNGIDVAGSYAYSDHHSDIPMLEAVGNPVAVNPDRELKRHSLKKGWKILSANRGCTG